MSNYSLIFENKEIFANYYLDAENESIVSLPNFKSINIIVGANNSGKSRFMRNLMTYKDYLFVNPHDYSYFSEKVEKHNYNNHIRSDIRSYMLKLTSIDLIRKEVSQILNTFESSTVPDYMDIKRELIDFQSIYLNNSSQKKYYIPTLRTAHSLFQNVNISGNNKIQKIEDDIFLETLNLYHNLKKNDVDIFTGIHLYKEILNTRNSKREIRKLFEKFEDFIGRNFFEGKKVDIVAEFDKDESLKGNNHKEIISFHIEGESETRKFYELGDGIQALIILMYKVFMAEKDSFIFIDEPELNLHPGMQRLFLEQISTNKDLTSKNLTYIISTHSNHFLDLTIEKENVSIYSFSKELNEKGDNKFIIKNVNAGDNQILKNLGVNNSSVFMANCSIWVEGISDRNYIKAFLYAYCKHKGGKTTYPKEDIDFAFFEYAGGNIEHYIFGEVIGKEVEDKILEDINTMALSNRIYLLADSDMAEEDSAKDLRLRKLDNLISDKKIEGKIFRHIRESENLLSKQVWKKILIEFCNKKLIEGKEGEIQEKINLKVDKLKLEQDKYIGDFLKKIKTNVDELNEVCKKSKQGTWLTFRDKAELSRVVLKKTVDGEITWEDFEVIPEVAELTKSVYRFIKG